jgi:glutathione S-transferase
MTQFELISNYLCPYTQRAAILLTEKELAYQRVYIDLADKPEWFVKLSPLGKVPVLRFGGAVVFETSVICEFIEDTAPKRPMLPSGAAERAHQRSSAEMASAMLADVFAFYMAVDAEALERKSRDLQARFRWLENQLQGGPYFAGATFGLADAAFAPVFRLFDTFDRIGDFGFFKSLSKVSSYRAALAARASVQQVVVPDYAQLFVQYLRARGSHLSQLISAQNLA